MSLPSLPPAIDCAIWEEGTGEPLFLIHGIGASHATWNGIVANLKSDFRCITYDLRGHGISPLPNGQFDLEALVSDLEAVRAKLGIEKAHFAGHSLGGMIGPAYARHFPDRVKTLGLLSTAAGRTEEDSAKVQGVVAAMERDGIENILTTLVDRWYTDDFAAKNPEIVQARLKQITGMSADVFLNVFHIYATTEMAPWLNEVKAPSLVLTGENDGACNPRLNRFIESQLDDCELVILEGLKHSILMEAPDQVAEHMRRFITLRS
ncbi:alpha/beta fold hydrolase [Roseovarius pelagicus]|uniref:Alpha/beta hydrolase n=1 Tax=Roseovarius pelagicus TaxID=2980108 RepID=A0ABY6D792_9RHOB|nr:alpha/beta hydrolase [Roseovarius pelagicus]UXX81754.1 alpha/beta hydrolase [Roseovarius pelagicus]